MYIEAIRILAKGYLPISPITTLKLKEILHAVKSKIRKINADYDMVIKRLHLYYDMKLATFSIDRNKNLIIQFPVFIQPYTKLPLVLYQIETVPDPIIDQNTQAYLYMHFQVGRTYISLKSETYITIRHQELRSCKRIGYKFYCKELFVVKHNSTMAVKVPYILT